MHRETAAAMWPSKLASGRASFGYMFLVSPIQGILCASAVAPHCYSRGVSIQAILPVGSLVWVRDCQHPHAGQVIGTCFVYTVTKRSVGVRPGVVRAP